MKIKTNNKVQSSSVYARSIATGTVFSGSIGDTPGIYFKGLDVVLCFDDGSYWTNGGRNEEWKLQIHDYILHKDAELTL